VESGTAPSPAVFSPEGNPLTSEREPTQRPRPSPAEGDAGRRSRTPPPAQAEGAPSQTVHHGGAPAGQSHGPMKTGVGRDLLRDFLYRFIACLKARRLYPPGHARLKKQLDAWFEVTEAILAEQTRLSIFVQPEAIFVNGEEFAGGPSLDPGAGRDGRAGAARSDPIVAEVIPEFVKRFLRYIALERGVTRQELEALTDLLLVEPEELGDAGGARAYLSEHAGGHVRLIEYEYDMASYADDEEELETTRTRELFYEGLLPEQRVVHRLRELSASSEEKQVLSMFLKTPAVADRLRELVDVMKEVGGSDGGRSAADLHVSDLIIHVVRRLARASESGDIDLAQSIDAFVALLEQLRTHLQAALAEAEGDKGRAMLQHVAKQMLSSPEALLHWATSKPGQPTVAVSSDLAEVLKLIFTREDSGPRSFTFGDTELQPLDVSEPEVIEQEAPKPRPPPPGTDVTELAKRFQAIEEELRDRRLHMDLSKLGTSYLSVLLELLAHEKDPGARRRLLEELQKVLELEAQQSQQGGGSRPVGLFERATAGLDKQERRALLAVPAIFSVALRELLQGNRRWSRALEEVAREHKAMAAEALGQLVLESEEPVQVHALDDLIFECEGELLDWVYRRLDDEGEPPPIQRLVALCSACQEVRVIPLVERLLGLAAPQAKRALYRLLVELDDPRAVELLTRQFRAGDAATREDILYLLGQSSQPAAESTLLEVALRNHLLGGGLRERLTAITALAHCGGELALTELGQMVHRWTLNFLPGGWTVRSRALEAISNIEDRLWTRRVESREPVDGS